MSSKVRESIADSIKTEIAAQQAHWASLGNKMFEESMSLFELNMKATNDSVGKMARSSRKLLEAKSPQEIFSVEAEEFQDDFNRMLSYGRNFSTIASKFQGEFNQSAQDQFNQFCGMMKSAAGEADNLAPEMLRNPAEFIKSAMESMKVGLEQWSTASRDVFQSAGGKSNSNLPEQSSTAKRAAKS